jgi:hypothetical protein
MRSIGEASLTFGPAAHAIISTPIRLTVSGRLHGGVVCRNPSTGRTSQAILHNLPLINALLGEGGQITCLSSLVYYWQKNTQTGSAAERKLKDMPRLDGSNRGHDCRFLASLELRAEKALVSQAKAARSGSRSRNRAQANTARDQVD